MRAGRRGALGAGDLFRPGSFAQLGFFAKLKSRAHGKQTAYTPSADACRACGLCVKACPEKAITLRRA